MFRGVPIVFRPDAADPRCFSYACSLASSGWRWPAVWTRLKYSLLPFWNSQSVHGAHTKEAQSINFILVSFQAAGMIREGCVACGVARRQYLRVAVRLYRVSVGRMLLRLLL